MGRPLGILILVALTAASHADWERFQETITRAEFDSLLTNVYCPSGAIDLTYGTNSVVISTNFTLRFGSSFIPHPSSFKKIVLDPGHIGGEWARLEERFFVRGKDRPIQEAELNLIVANLLQSRLTNAGIAVSLTKTNYQPVTTERPENFRAQAEYDVPASADVAVRADTVRRRQEILFYRSAEIAARAKLVNEILQPDLTICIHFNAVEWDECRSLVADNRLLFFVHGNYLPAEAADPRLFEKLLERSYAVELAVAES
ncbi:MAG: N-acetylmuramoyl-L-alanine amidase, partial [Verrucomicrobiota bacterium]